MLGPADDDAADFTRSGTGTHVAGGGLCGLPALLLYEDGVSPTELALCDTDALFGSHLSAAAEELPSCAGGCDLVLVSLPLLSAPQDLGTRHLP